MSNEEEENQGEKKNGVTRREFIKDAGLVVGGVALGSMTMASACGKTITTTQTETITSPPLTKQAETVTLPATTTTTTVTPLATTVTVVPVAKSSSGYILCDSSKCCGCRSCMQACSLVHDGKINLSQSRIQVLYNAFGGYPNDIFIKQCRQCTNAPCVTACPFKAITIDSKTGVRSVNATLCTGCQTCLSINACPYLPFRIAGGGGTNKVVMCDLCSNATYWNKVGGPSGTQACVEICTMQALKFSSTVPTDYETNLKSANYLALTAITANVKTA